MSWWKTIFCRKEPGHHCQWKVLKVLHGPTTYFENGSSTEAYWYHVCGACGRFLIMVGTPNWVEVTGRVLPGEDPMTVMLRYTPYARTREEEG